MTEHNPVNSLRFLVLLGSFAAATAQANPAELYQEKCAYCHGTTGDGQSPASHSLRVKPTNFIKGEYKYRSTPYGSFPTQDDLIQTINNGLPGTAMPAWAGLLSAGQIQALADYIKTFAAPPVTPGTPLTVPTASFARADLAQGRKLYQQTGCVNCHGEQLDGQPDQLHRIKAGITTGVPARDLTDFRNYRGGASLEAIYTRIYTGLNGTAMPGYNQTLSEQDIIDLAAYLKSVYETKEQSRWLEEPYATQEQRGDYLLSIGTCELCHSPAKNGAFMDGLNYAGGMKVISAADGTFYSRNITSNAQSGIGNWTIEQLRQAIKYGQTPDGGTLYGFTMPWLYFYNLTDQDADALAYALKRIPEVYNKIPVSEPGGFWQGFKTKFKIMLGRMERNLVFARDNYGQRNPALGQQMPDYSPARHWSIVPPMGIIPPEKMVKAAGFELPAAPATASPQLAAKLARGRYLVGVTPCTLCHTPVAGTVFLKAAESQSGGMKIELDNVNTVYSANLTPDKETGLGNWSAAEIRRAIRSGIKKDGRIMHFQGMPWPVFANMTEADTEAVVAYLQALPAVHKKMPAPAPSHSPDYIIADQDHGIRN